eukprot:3492943-Rhodomonas_salina.1
MKLNGRELVLPGVVKGDVSAAHALRARLDEAARRGRIDVPLADQVCQPVQLLLVCPSCTAIQYPPTRSVLDRARTSG